MEQYRRDDLGFYYDPEKAKAAQEELKVVQHATKNGKNVVSVIGQKEVDARLAATDEEVRKINDSLDRTKKRSTQKHHATKKTKKINPAQAKKIAVVGVAAVLLIASAPVLIKAGVEKAQTIVEYNDSIEYMNTYIMPKVCLQAGFDLESIQKGSGATFDYDRQKVEKAVRILINDYGFTEAEARTLIEKYLGNDEKFYDVTGSDSEYEYYENLGYKNENHLEDLFVSPATLADRDLRSDINLKVDNIQESSEIGGESNARS